MRTSLVIGLGFGDEGKGRTVSYLTSLTPKTLVVRFNGGHQAGHTVVCNGVRHVFSSFGSGSIQEAPTLWSKNCTFYPTGVVNEYKILGLKTQPMLYVDPLCPVTTPFDIDANRQEEQNRLTGRHGSVGIGFGTTVARHEKYFKLYFQDLFYDSILKAKLENIERYYYTHADNISWEPGIKKFLEDVQFIRNSEWIKLATELKLTSFDHIIFEGAQGILLDMDFGFFPNVTRSNTTSKNALELIREWNLPNPEIYYVTRAYQTRHGIGFMTNEEHPPKLINNADETNSSKSFQGKFRTARLDIDLLRYALDCDQHFSKGLTKHLIVTCIDQMHKGSGPFFATEGNKVHAFNTKGLYSIGLANYTFNTVISTHGEETFLIRKEWGE